MGDGNGQTEDKQVINTQSVKHCPFLNGLCMGEKCALYSELMQNMAGLQKKFGLCSFNAVVLILSEMNQKATIESQKFQLPKGLLRG